MDPYSSSYLTSSMGVRYQVCKYCAVCVGMCNMIYSTYVYYADSMDIKASNKLI